MSRKKKKFNDCQCKKVEDIRIHVMFEGKTRYFVETCMKCGGRVYEKKRFFPRFFKGLLAVSALYLMFTL